MLDRRSILQAVGWYISLHDGNAQSLQVFLDEQLVTIVSWLRDDRLLGR